MEHIKELKPMKLGGIFDKTFKLVFENAKLFFILYLIFYLIFFPTTFLFQIFGKNLSSSINSTIILMVSVIIVAIIILFLYLMLISLFLDILCCSFMNEAINIKKSIKKVFSKSWIYLFSSFFSMLAFMVGYSMCVLPCIVAFIFFSLYAPAIFYENKGVFTSIGRSFRLVTYSFFPILGMWLLFLLMIILASLMQNLFIYLLQRIGSLIDPDLPPIPPITSILNGGLPTFNITPISIAISIINYIIVFIVNLISLTVFCSFTVVLFFNQKIKFENFGIENLAESFIKNENEHKNIDG